MTRAAGLGRIRQLVNIPFAQRDQVPGMAGVAAVGLVEDLAVVTLRQR